MRLLPACLVTFGLLTLACAGPEDKDDDGTGSTDDDTTSANVEAACHVYLDAYEACVQDYAVAMGSDPSDLDLDDSYCDAYAGVEDAESAALLRCYADVYATADCSSSDGFSAAADDLSDCE